MAEQLPVDVREEMAIPSYLHRNPALRWMAWRRLEVLTDMLRRSLARSADPMSTVIDFGCGTGVLLDAICQVTDRVYGVDVRLDAAALLVKEWGLEQVTLLNPERLVEVVPAESVDAIVAAEVLEHIAELPATLATLRSRLKPHGTLLVSLPTENRLYRLGRRLAGFTGHYHRADAASVHRSVCASGFRSIELRRIPAGGALSIYWLAEYMPTMEP
jgi:predicted TPR repeat methyltransferase